MAVYGVISKKNSQEILAQAKAFFGDEGLGLTVSREDRCCVSFVGGGGHVTLTPFEGHDGRDVELETREWDFQVRDFIGRI